MARSLSDEVYEELRSSIITGSFRPNQRLIETDLAQDLSASRTPVREALQRLAAEGLIVSYRRGWVVREFTTGELKEIYEVRAALEGYASRLAAERAAPEQIAAIAAVAEKQAGGHIRSGSQRRASLLELNDTFHDAVIEATGNERLADFIRRNRAYYSSFALISFYTDDEVKASVTEHRAISQAIQKGNGEQAEAVARRHIMSGLKLLVAKLR